MDKASVALSATEDNAAAIRELNKKLNSRAECRLIVGKTTGTSATFGKVTSDGNTAVIVTFAGSSTTINLYFRNELINTSPSPLLAVLPKGSGELRVGIRAAHALIIG